MWPLLTLTQPAGAALHTVRYLRGCRLLLASLLNKWPLSWITHRCVHVYTHMHRYTAWSWIGKCIWISSCMVHCLSWLDSSIMHIWMGPAILVEHEAMSSHCEWNEDTVYCCRLYVQMKLWLMMVKWFRRILGHLLWVWRLDEYLWNGNCNSDDSAKTGQWWGRRCAWTK